MYEYMIGIITDIQNNHIILEVNHVGYRVLVNKPTYYSLNSEYKVFLYDVVREKEILLYGFSTLIHKELFITFLNVKGVGPQIALNLSAKNPSEIHNALNNKNVNFFTAQKKIGKKLATQIILELSTSFEISGTENHVDELIIVLKSMGYSQLQIDNFLDNNLVSANVQLSVEAFLKSIKT